MTDRAASKPPSRLAKAVRMERDRKGWTSERLADAAGVSHSWVRNFEAGIIQNPGAGHRGTVRRVTGAVLPSFDPMIQVGVTGKFMSRSGDR